MRKKIKRLTIELEEDLLNNFKIYCINNDISMKDFLTDYIKSKLNIT